MGNANEILIVGGACVLSFGFLLGIPMAVVRGRSSRAPRYLFAAHLAAIIQGGMLLALTVAMDFSGLSRVVEAVAAYLLVAGVIFFDTGLILNWLQGVQDAFAEKSLGNKVSAIGTPCLLGGMGVVLFGVISGVF